MEREFPDELLSALLDDELTPAERALVEQHLATSEADRQLLAELKSLRGDLASLPQVNIHPDFADRVVQAALAATAAPTQPAVVTGGRPGFPSTAPRRWTIRVTLGIAALAAAMLVYLRPWSSGAAKPPGGHVAVSPAPKQAPPTNGSGQTRSDDNSYEAILRQTALGDGEAIVLRLSADREAAVAAALDAALAKAGIRIAPEPVDATSAAAAMVRAYRNSVGQRTAGEQNATVAPAEAVFIEAPLGNLEEAFAELAAAVSQPLRLTREARLALASIRGGDAAEGEPGSATKAIAANASSRPVARHLPTALFPMPRQSSVSPAVATGGGGTFDPHRPVRVLILVEQR